MTREDEDTVRVRRDSVGLGSRSPSAVFPSPAAAHREVDALDGNWREREAGLRRENERLRAKLSSVVAERESFRSAVRATQDLVEKRDKEIAILRKAVGR